MPRNLLRRVLKRDTRPQQRSQTGRRRLLLESLEHRRVLAVTGAFDLTTGVLDISITDTAMPGEGTDANLIGDGIKFFIDANDNRLFDSGEASGPIAALRQVNVSGGSGQVGNFSWIGDFSSAPMELGDSGGFVISVSNVHSVSLEATLHAAGNVHFSGVSVEVSGQITASSPSGSGVVIDATQQAFVPESVRASVASDESSAASPLALPSVTIIGEHVTLAGATIDVSAVGGDVGVGVGGTVTVTGDEVILEGAEINASGVNGAGEIYIGGGFQGNDPNIRNAQNTFIDAHSVMTADALQTGDGGTVIVWSDGHTDFFGTISNQGAPLGRGGFTEVSGKQTLRYAGSVNTGGGMLLLDPTDFTINAGTDAQTDSSIGADTLVTELGNNNVTLQTTAAGTEDGDITVSADVLWNSTNSLTLLAHRNIAFNASVQNSNTTGGDVNIVAGWDGTTAFDATTFLAEDITSTTLFGNNDGSIFIGSSTQTTGIAVGSRHGNTNVFGHDLTLRGSDSSRAYAQLGFYDVTGQGLAADSDITTGNINVLATGTVLAQGGTQGESGLNQTSSYVQVGHGGNRQQSRLQTRWNYGGDITLAVGENINFAAGNGSTTYALLGNGGSGANGNHSGNHTITTAKDIIFTAGGPFTAFAQFGNGGGVAFGDHSGNHTIAQANDITFRAGGGRAYAQLGNGGFGAFGDHQGDHIITLAKDITFEGGQVSDGGYAQLGNGGGFAVGNHSGNHTITLANDITFLGGVSGGGSGFNRYAQLGNGGWNADGNHSGNHTITLANNINFAAGREPRAYAQLGNGGYDANGSHSGVIDVTTSGNLTLSGQDTIEKYALVGHGDEPGDSDASHSVAGDINIRVGGNLSLTNAFLGHLIDGDGTYSANDPDSNVIGGNTFLGVRGDLTADANSQFFSAAPAQNGELRFYVGGQDQVDSNTLLNGVVHGGTPFPNNQGNFGFGDGPYTADPANDGNFAYYGLADVFNYTVDATEATNIADALATGDVTLAFNLDQPHFGAEFDWDGGTQFITINSNLDYDSTNKLNLFATGDATFNANVQNRNLTGGDINVVAGWDGTTPFDATTFRAADVNTTTLFANNDGSIFIGDGEQTSGIAVGSRHGNTNVFAHDLTLRGSDTNLAYAQLGFHDVTGQGLGTGSVITTGDINAALTGGLDAQAGSQGFLSNNAQTSSYVQLGHGGNRIESRIVLTLFNYTGNVTLSVKEDINFTAGNAYSVYSQLGHGGSTARGSHSGLITITQANDLTFKAGNGLDAYSQLGHGGVSAGEFGSGGIHTGIITITRANDLTFMAGDGSNAYSQLGHGGRSAPGSSSGLITITQANDLTLMAGNGGEAYSQLGHGGVRADGNRSGEIDVTLAGDLTLTGVNTTRQYAVVGHGDEPEDVGQDQNNTVAGDVSLRAGGNVTLTNAFLGHLIDNNGTYTSGNTSLGVRGDLTADANSQVFSAAPAQNGELRFYVGGQDLVNSNTLLNGVAHGGAPFPNNQGNFAFGAGPYNPAPNTNFAYYRVTIEDRSFIVTIPTDTVDAFDHETSLREAVDFANSNPGADTITFDASLANQTIPITLGQIVVTETGADNRTTINGPSGGIVISGNHATRPIQINGGVFATLDGLTFVDGYADQGGAIVNLGDLTVSNSTFRNNFADTNAGASGGVGGAISNLGVLNVSNSLFYLNRGELGGAINSSNGLTVTDSIFSSNEALFNGGGLRSFGTTIISGSTFSNNQAANGGGGLINHGDLTIVNSTLAHNTALDGGGLQVFGGTAELTHVTVAYNTATRAGGGLAANVSTVTATNTIIAGNSAANQNDVWGNLAPASSFNLLNQSAATAGLDTFGDNGGLTQTVALLTGSPALDAGTNTVALPEFDQRGTGFDRIAGGGVDIGAFELQNQAPVFTSPETADVPENTQAVLALSASDPDVPAQTITFSITGSGADNDKFEIVSGNQLRFKVAPDFETPQDVGGVAAGDNVYEVTVSAADGNGGVTNQVIAVTVIDTDEIAPTLASFTRQAPSQMLTNSDVLQFHVAFSESVQNVDPTDFVVNGGSSASVTEVVPVQGTGEAIYLLTVSGGDLAIFNGSVGIDLAAAQNITDPAGNPLPTVEPAIDETYTLDTIAPQVTDVIIDDGRSQRSRVRAITINFDSEIVFDAGAFELKTFAGVITLVQTSIAPGVATNQVVLSFPGTIGGSLADGDYRLRILDTHVRDAAGNTLDGDGNGNPGAARVDEFFRFFGDFDGDRDVDDRDFLAFRRSYRRDASDSRFESAFDFDGDGDVDGSDFVQFRRNYRRSL
jgi:hypothetical protein